VWGERRLYARPSAAHTGLYASAEAALCAPGALVQTSTLFLSAALARALPFDETLPTHHEPDLLMRLYARGGAVRMLPDVLAVWDDRVRPGRFSAGKIAAAEGWWRGVEQAAPSPAWRSWRWADDVQRLRAGGGAPIGGLWRMARTYGPAAALKGAAQIAAPRAYRALQEARLAAAVDHALHPEEKAAFEALRRAVAA
jgi:hypothetical protein